MTGRQQRFVLEYPRDCNATKAAIRAGYSENGAQQAGSRLLSNTVIFEEIQAAIERHLAKLDLSLERIIQEAARVGISDLRDLFTEAGQLLAPHELPEDVRRAVSSVKVLKTQVEVDSDGDRTTTTRLDTVEIKFWPKLQALKLVGELKGLMKPQLQLEDGDSWLDVLNRMTAKQLADKGADSPPAAARGVGTDHKGHHGSNES